ncbi:hypothetical protein ACF3DV_16235 [Chlorogloeopsis fritschii PCC 9212]|uniref:Uncharacterized protein n=1 Tax=Chlorogloeopsis fritschii PCC 6912 TaxID=211165 RepID=A0A3S0ZH72_CHLFR|nr:hypothetical protein [Chlorogloeopsis fritschii]RUR72795.1 hypothetical protein PCC6912_60660 [Chlorogloeopsis fritschii PCC 6912]
MTTIAAKILPLKNIDALGRCYDILQLDPLRIGESSKHFSAVTFIPEKFEPIPDQSALNLKVQSINQAPVGVTLKKH